MCWEYLSGFGPVFVLYTCSTEVWSMHSLLVGLRSGSLKSLRSSDAYVHRYSDHHWFDNGLSPGRRQAIIWTNAGILLIWPLGTNFSEILIKIPSLSFKKMHLKMSSVKWRPVCLGLNVSMARMGFVCMLWSRQAVKVVAVSFLGGLPAGAQWRKGHSNTCYSIKNTHLCIAQKLVVIYEVLCTPLPRWPNISPGGRTVNHHP